MLEPLLLCTKLINLGANVAKRAGQFTAKITDFLPGAPKLGSDLFVETRLLFEVRGVLHVAIPSELAHRLGRLWSRD